MHGVHLFEKALPLRLQGLKSLGAARPKPLRSPRMKIARGGVLCECVGARALVCVSQSVCVCGWVLGVDVCGGTTGGGVTRGPFC